MESYGRSVHIMPENTGGVESQTDVGHDFSIWKEKMVSFDIEGKVLEYVYNHCT